MAWRVTARPAAQPGGKRIRADKDSSESVPPVRTGPKEIKQELSPTEIQEVLYLLLRSGLNQAQATRELQSVVFQTFLVPTSSEPVQAAQAAGKAYSEQAKGKKAEEHGLGPPHTFKFLDFLEEALEQPAEGKSGLKTFSTPP